MTPQGLQLVLNRELQKALKSRSAFTVVTITLERLTTAAPADERTLMKISNIVERDMRERDFIGHVGSGSTALVLLNSDYARAVRIADRLLADLQHRALPASLKITVGAACYPTHATNAAALVRWALTHPISNWTTGRNLSDM